MNHADAVLAQYEADEALYRAIIDGDKEKIDKARVAFLRATEDRKIAAEHGPLWTVTAQPTCA